MQVSILSSRHGKIIFALELSTRFEPETLLDDFWEELDFEFDPESELDLEPELDLEFELELSLDLALELESFFLLPEELPFTSTSETLVELSPPQAVSETVSNDANNAIVSNFILLENIIPP